MRQSLQSKFNLLGLLLVAFFLLMLPMFTQVKQDTRDSLKEARNTALYKFTRELARDFQPPKDLEDTQVEDYWDEYQKEAREADPDCPACNPDGDADGDNMTNKEEVEQNRNPLCNEEEKGVEYCQNVDDKVEDPDNPIEDVAVLLLNETISFPQDCQQGLFLGTCASHSFEVNGTYRELRATLNVTGYSGLEWNFNINGGGAAWERNGSWSGGQSQSPRDYPLMTGRLADPEEATYSTSLVVRGSPGVHSGNWHIVVIGIR